MVLLAKDKFRKCLTARFYRTLGGREPVREWLKTLSIADRKIIGEDIKDVEFSWPIGLPLVRPLGRGLWEVRSSITDGKIARVIFCVDQGEMFLLHGFIKKTQKIPARDLELALNRFRGKEK
jgi:phage-related protein